MLIEILLIMPACQLAASLPGSITPLFELGAPEKMLVGGILNIVARLVLLNMSTPSTHI